MQPGDVKFFDANNDGVIDNNDIIPIGYPQFAEINYSMRFGFDYKGFDFNVLFQGTENANLRVLGGQLVREFVEFNASPKKHHLGRWTPETADQATFRRMGTDNTLLPLTASYYLLNSAYLRLKNIQLGYTLPDHVSQMMRLSKVRVFVNGFNVFTWAKTTIADPEFGQGANYPQTKIYNAGINVTF